ncbi:MAG: uncharacterized protein QOK49_662 [Baekduia sp.]|jgi:uncharacterized membrane protein YfcA|nr:uncharacterized protein [Baekduia sp.]
MTVGLVAAAALVASCVQATTGLGFALLLTPVLFAVLPPEPAIVTITISGAALNVLVLLAEGRRPRVAWGEVGPILVWAVPGGVCGLLILRGLSKPTLQIIVGVSVIVAALVRVGSGAAPISAGSPRGRRVLGFATGALTLSTGVNGPPAALWLSRRGLGASELRDSLSAMFLGTAAIAALTLAPVLHRSDFRPGLLAAALGGTVLGHALGSRAFAQLEGRRFDIVLLVVILAAGVASVVSGAANA